jgi:hypothetical protein
MPSFGPMYAHTKPPHSSTGYALCLTFCAIVLSAGSETISSTLPSTSIFQPWYRQRSPHSSLRPKNSEARRCGQNSSITPTRPSVSRNTTSRSPNIFARTGLPSGSLTSSLKQTGCQCRRMSCPIGASPSTRQRSSFSSLVSMQVPLSCRPALPLVAQA